MDLAEILKSILGEDDEHLEILMKIAKGEDLTDEDIAKAKEIPEKALKAIGGALNILDKYKDDYPQDILNAIKTLAKYAAYGYGKYPAKKGMTDEELLAELTDFEKAGAKLSKATIEQIKKIIDICQKLVGEKEKKIKKEGDEKLSPETIKKLEEYERLRKAEEDRIKKEKEDAEKAKQKEVDELKRRIEKLEKRKPVKKGIEGQDEDEDKDDDTPRWPSLTGSEEE